MTVNFVQTQNNVFKFPSAIDIFENGTKTRHHVFVDGRDSSFKFIFEIKSPNLIQVNADGVLLEEFSENKILSDYIFQLKNADNYLHKREALLKVAEKQEQKQIASYLSQVSQHFLFIAIGTLILLAIVAIGWE